jgi:hypothetical protein
MEAEKYSIVLPESLGKVKCSLLELFKTTYPGY